jgi:hypothetical protein
VKTGNEVPASVHGPCFVEIGGDEPAGSSYAGLPAGERSSRRFTERDGQWRWHRNLSGRREKPS